MISKINLVCLLLVDIHCERQFRFEKIRVIVVLGDFRSVGWVLAGSEDFRQVAGVGCHNTILDNLRNLC